MAIKKDITGQRFGHLTAIEYTHRALSTGRRMSAWAMRCDCGNEVVAMTVNLMKGKHKSCGCMSKKLAAETYRSNHPKVFAARPEPIRRLAVTKLPEYRIYRQMLDRCYLPTAANYPYYGKRGVRVCDRWRFGEGDKTGFICFYEDLGPRPQGLTLDRENPFEDYSPGNCRWAGWSVQQTNKREHHLSASQRAGIAKFRAVQRRTRCTDEAISRTRKMLADGVRQVDIAKAVGITQQTVSLIKNGHRLPIAEM